MDSFFKFVAAIATALLAVFTALTLIDYLSKDNRKNELIKKLHLERNGQPRKESDIEKILERGGRKIKNAVKKTGKAAEETVEEAAEEVADIAEDISEAVEDVKETVEEIVEDAAEEIDLSEDDLDDLLG